MKVKIRMRDESIGEGVCIDLDVQAIPGIIVWNNRYFAHEYGVGIARALRGEIIPGYYEQDVFHVPNE